MIDSVTPFSRILGCDVGKDIIVVSDSASRRLVRLANEPGALAQFAGELSHDESRKFLADVAGFGSPSPILVMTGGDPLCRPDLFDLLAQAGIKPKYTAVIGTVQGDLHDIGKNLVAMMLKGANFGVVDIGTNVPPEKFIAAIKESNASVVALSALLTTTRPAMKSTVEAIRAAGLKDVKIIIGGAPVTQDYSNEIGADGYSADAASAVDLALGLVGETK